MDIKDAYEDFMNARCDELAIAFSEKEADDFNRYMWDKYGPQAALDFAEQHPKFEDFCWKLFKADYDGAEEDYLHDLYEERKYQEAEARKLFEANK